MKIIGKTATSTHMSKSSLGQELTEWVTQFLPLRADMTNCITLTEGTVNECLLSKWCQHRQVKSVQHFQDSQCEEHVLS